MANWYEELAEVTKAPIRAAGFEPIVHLLLERSANAILMQSLAERWWDTTPTFYIAKREMTMTPYDFHRMIGLRCDGTIINLEGELGTWLVINLLGRRYSLDTILRRITSPFPRRRLWTVLGWLGYSCYTF